MTFKRRGRMCCVIIKFGINMRGLNNGKGGSYYYSSWKENPSCHFALLRQEEKWKEELTKLKEKGHFCMMFINSGQRTLLRCGSGDGSCTGPPCISNVSKGWDYVKDKKSS